MRRLVAIAASAFALLGLFVVATACQGLVYDNDTGSTTTTAVEDQDVTALFGTWDGTYTADGAWDENGAVEDPPFELGTPVTMRVELRPWSAETADYGTIVTGDLYPARVASLELEGDQVTIVAVSEESGLEDLITVFELTLDDKTLTGQDDREPEVPSGWLRSTGDVLLTRTAPWDDTATTETTAAESPSDEDDADSSGADAGAAEDGASDDTEDSPTLQHQEPMDLPEPVLTLGADDSGGHATVRVGDRVSVEFQFTAADAVTQVDWSSTSPATLWLNGWAGQQDPTTHIYSRANATFIAAEPGDVGMLCLSRHEDGTLFEFWQYYLVVED